MIFDPKKIYLQMESLPNEVICHILDFCSEIPLKIAAVCSLWREHCFKGKSFSWLISYKFHHGDLIFLQNILNERTWDLVITTRNLKLVAKYGHTHIFNWLDGLKPPTVPEEKNIHDSGRIEGLRPPPPTPEEKYIRNLHSLVLNTAIKEGQICMLEVFLSKGRFEYKYSQLNVYKLAARFGRIDVIQWAEEKKFYNTEAVCQNAAREGQLETLKWLRERNYPWDYRTTSDAARMRHEEIVKWSVENGCERSPDAFAMAAETCTLELIKWLWDKNYPIDLTNSVSRACQGANIETANWLISRGVPFDKEKCLKIFTFRKEFEKENYIYMVAGKWV